MGPVLLQRALELQGKAKSKWVKPVPTGKVRAGEAGDLVQACWLPSPSSSPPLQA